MLIGYARVSTNEQDLSSAQSGGLCPVVQRHRVGIAYGAAAVQAGAGGASDGEDTLVVWCLDRLGRSLRHLIELIGEFERRQLGFRSLTEGIDTSTTSSGRLVFHIFGAIAEFERQLIRERTQAGLKAACARGRLGGRRTVITDEKLRVARDMLAGGQHTMQQIADTIGVGRATLYRHLDHRRSRTPPSPPPPAAPSAPAQPAVATDQAKATHRTAAQAGPSPRPGSTKDDSHVHRARSAPVGRPRS